MTPTPPPNPPPQTNPPQSNPSPPKPSHPTPPTNQPPSISIRRGTWCCAPSSWATSRSTRPPRSAPTRREPSASERLERAPGVGHRACERKRAATPKSHVPGASFALRRLENGFTPFFPGNIVTWSIAALMVAWSFRRKWICPAWGSESRLITQRGWLQKIDPKVSTVPDGAGACAKGVHLRGFCSLEVATWTDFNMDPLGLRSVLSKVFHRASKSYAVFFLG